MDYKINFKKHDEFLQATVTGKNEANIVSAYLADILAECQRQSCFCVLIDEQLEGERLDASEVFDIASAGAQQALGVFQAVAYVEESMGAMAEFAETVAINRGMPVRVFRTVAEAEHWLIAQTEGEDEQYIFTRVDTAGE